MASDDPTASKEWNDGCDFAMTQLCKFLDVEPSSVSWDAATETVEGDVSAVIGNILRAKFGEDWGPQCQAVSAPQSPLLEAVEKIAKQALSTETDGVTGDYEYGYDECVRVARAALTRPLCEGGK